MIAMRVANLIMRHPKLVSSNYMNLKRLVFHLAHRHTTSVECNAFVVNLKLVHKTCTRYSIYDALCKINHSCVPNVEHIISEDSFVTCKTLKSIKKGDQIFINYLGDKEFSTPQKRTKYIQEIWKFNCSCEKCGTEL